MLLGSLKTNVGLKTKKICAAEEKLGATWGLFGKIAETYAFNTVVKAFQNHKLCE